uniref:CRAL-TRIO domain-containing protein n=1 Tax=Chenopodium quinoa TaxID=63459 RepID=A0A803L6S4_CHEQI
MFLFKSSQNHDGNDPLQRDAKVKELKVALGPLSGRNAKFCTDACLRRYLEARNCNVDKAKKMVEETLKWRDAYKPEEIRWNTTSAEGNVRHLVYLLENAILNLPEGQEQMVWMIDYTGFSMSTSLSVRTARDIINILQNHYPERLGIAVLYNPPRIFYAFWRAVKYFLDPKTSQKVKFVYPKNKDSAELMRSYFDVENLPKEFGGIATLEYDHEEFSRMMAEDDIKASRYWGFDDKSSYAAQGCVTRDVSVQPILPSGHSKAEVAPEPF